MKEGKTVSAIPAPTRVSKYGINWDKYVEIAKMTGQPVLAGHNVRESQVKSMRQYTRPPFIQEDGHVVIALRNSKVESGVRTGDVYFEWVSTQKKEQ